MCRQVLCDSCKKITWAGCGEHIAEAMAGVPDENRCTCERQGPAAQSASIFSRLFGK
ncbi:unannotated protein [freshwater metagenome]|uniref:Unannotated protein n=1 Tax=freshwater metagenome TaxID=449393 RepID=A0A6J5Z5Z0_9ZZZZ